MNVQLNKPATSASQWALWRTWRKLRMPPFISLMIVMIFLFCAIFAPFIAPHSPVQGTVLNRLIPPIGMEGSNSDYILGTDRLGRDTFSRLLYGARISLTISIISVIVTGAIGSFCGLAAGYFGGWADTILMRLVDLSLAMPGILIAMLLAAAFKASFTNVVIVVVLILWPRFARVVRSETLSIKQQDFVALARVAALSDLTIMLRHILPNLLPSILVISTLQVGFIIVLEASLSFLGVGIPPPVPSWGRMVSDGRGLIERAWWISILPGVAILITVISLNNLGDWLRDRLDPKLRQM